MKIDGACHCGRITYEAEIDPERVILCHCTDCQTLSGTAFRTIVPVTAADFRLSGEPKVYVKTAESGRKRAQAFCPDCGAPIYASAVGEAPKHYFLRLGTCRQRAELAPRKQIWARSAVPWLADIPGVPKLAEQ